MSLKEALILSLGLIVAAFVFGFFFYESRETGKTIRIVGTATRGFDSDILKWRLTLARNVPPSEVTGGYTRLAKDVQNVAEELGRKGIIKEQIVIQSVQTQPVYGSSGVVTGYTIQQGIIVTSPDIASLEKLAFSPGDVLKEGTILQNSNVEYYFSKLSEIKKELIGAAVIDARQRAESIAKHSGTKIKGIHSARVGVFQITEPYSTEVTDSGIYNVNTKRKDVTVTVHAIFSLH
jgi:hypothetical protein